MVNLSHNSFQYLWHFFHLIFTEVREVDFLYHLTGLWKLLMMNLHYFAVLLLCFLIHMLIVGERVMQSV
jgi:hypothetical protein